MLIAALYLSYTKSDLKPEGQQLSVILENKVTLEHWLNRLLSTNATAPA